MKVLHLLAVTMLLGSAGVVSAAFTVIGPLTVDNSPIFDNVTGSGTSSSANSGTGLLFNPQNQPAASNFYSWSNIGPDSTPLGATLLPFSTTQGTLIAAVYLVSNTTNATLASPPTLGGGANLSHQTAYVNFSADFSVDEPVLFANAAMSGIIIDFGVPVQAAGFRVQATTAGARSDFFISAYNPDGFGGFTSVVSSSGRFTEGDAPNFSNSSSFYGVQGGNSSETFQRLFFGYSGASAPTFGISTLEVIGPSADPTNAVPVPPTLFAGLMGGFGLAGVRWVRRRRV